MTPAKARTPAVEGWFTMDPVDACAPRHPLYDVRHLFLPTRARFCRNPACDGTELEEVPLSRRGKVWSFTDNRYQPPAPYMSSDPFEPYAIATVELAEEKMVVLGQLAAGATIDTLRVGQEVEVVLDTLYEDDDNTYVVWKWQPV